MIVVCDTNVLVSGFAFPGGLPAKILLSIISGRIVHATSPDLLTELQRILEKKIRLAVSRVEAAIGLMTNISRMTYPSQRLRIVKSDDADNRVLECAMTAGASCIVTGDKAHLLPLRTVQGIGILSPCDFSIQAGLV